MTVILRLIFFTVILILLSPIVSDAKESLASREGIDQVKKRALDTALATSREWLLMSHYRKRTILGGYKSEIDGNDYFLDKNGRLNPEAEAQATIEAFSQPVATGNDEHPQCRYIGRRNFLFERLAITEIPKLECPAHASWKKQLDVVGASIIFASAYFGNPASMFGHTFLKLQSKNNRQDRDLLNYGVNFAANTGVDGGAAFAIRGLAGGYRGEFGLLPYHQTLKDYTNLEGRDVYEYTLNLTPAELDRMLDHLLEIQNTHFDYYFLDENCSYQLLALLEIARPSVHLTDKFVYFVIPADTVRRVVSTNQLVGEIKYRPSLVTELYSSAYGLSEAEKVLTRELVHQETPPTDLASLPAIDQAKVYDGALRYVSLLAYDKPDRWREHSHSLQKQRAALGVRSPSSTSEAPARPEQGHDSSQLALGYGERDTNTFVEYHVRAAYHHLLSNETGYLPSSHLEIFKLSGRSYIDPSDTLLQEISILDIMALSPWSAYFRPLSWKANFGVARLPDQPFSSALAFTTTAGVGNALAFGQSQNVVWFSFLQLHSDSGGDLEKNSRTGAGVQTQILIKPFYWLRATAGAEYRNYFLGGEYKFSRAFGEAGLSINRNLELRGGYSRTANVDEGKAVLIHHLLF